MSKPALSPDGRTLAAGDCDHVRVWDVKTGKMVHCFWKPKSTFRCAAFSPHGDLIVAGTTSGTLYVWRLRDGVEVASLQASGSPGTEGHWRLGWLTAVLWRSIQMMEDVFGG